MTPLRPSKTRAGADRSGQAVLELAVGLFALLAAIVGILVVGLLSRARSDAMVAAQRKAVEASCGVVGDGLKSGSGEASVALPPAAKPMFGIEPEQTAEEEVWMPATGVLR